MMASHRKVKKASKQRSKDNESPLYFPWLVMCNSCTNPKSKGYSDLGGRGITVCDEWKEDFHAFETWSRTHGWEDGLKIDRYDLDGPFSPDNCVWGNVKRATAQSMDKKMVLAPKRRVVPSLPNGQTCLSDFLE